jgi:aryl-alcohol dehydrogenase-like predicted oxidoreductase
MIEETEAALPRRRVGKTPYELSIVGCGGWMGLLFDPKSVEGAGERDLWSGMLADPVAREQAAIAAIRRAVELGINYFDTAPMYQDGEAERLLGIGLNALPSEDRDQVYISTKVGWHPERPHQYDASSIHWSLEKSLKQLFTDHIDIIHIHYPYTDEHMVEILAPGGAVEALEGLKAEGVIGAISLGVRPHRFLRRAIQSGRFDAIMTTYDYHPARSTAAPVIDEAYAAGVGVFNASPYNAGLLAGVDPDWAAHVRPPNSPEDLIQAKELWAWANEWGVNLGAVAMQFSLRNEKIAVTVAGPRSAEQVEDNVRHALSPLPADIWEALAAVRETLTPASPGGEAGTPA